MIHLKESKSSAASISLHGKKVKEKQEYSDQDYKQEAGYSETQLAKLKEENKKLQVQLQKAQVGYKFLL